jgi:hypothetical protein
MTPDGRVPNLSEEPELPHGEFSYRIGPLLIGALPVFPVPGSGPPVIAPADTQSLFDPGEPRRAMIKSDMGGDRRNGKGEVEGKRRWTLCLGGAARGGALLSGEGAFTFDPKAGFPRELHLDLSGELPADTGSAAASKFAMRMRLAYRFEVLEPSPQ